MANSTEETTSVVITGEDREAAETLIKLSQDTRYQPTDGEGAAPSSTQLLPQVSKAPQKPCSYKCKSEEKQHSKKDDKIPKSTKGKRVKLEVDDTDETLMILQEWNRTKPDSMNTIFKDVAELFSEPIKKQLTMSDVEIGQCRLMLGKQQVQKKMLPLLEHSEIPKGGLDVSVYGPNGEVQTMKFKMWGEDTRHTPVLTTGWNDFKNKYNLEKFCDFLTIWMFRQVSGKICFAIDKNRFHTITGPLSSRISNSVFENPN